MAPKAHHDRGTHSHGADHQLEKTSALEIEQRAALLGPMDMGPQLMMPADSMHSASGPDRSPRTLIQMVDEKMDTMKSSYKFSVRPQKTQASGSQSNKASLGSAALCLLCAGWLAMACQDRGYGKAGGRGSGQEVAEVSKVGVKLTVEGIDYINLEANSNLSTAFKEQVQQSLAAQSGVDSADVVVDLKPGSVIAECQIRVPAGTQLGEKGIRKNLSSKSKINSNVLEHLRKIGALTQASSGPIVVTSEVKPPPTKTPAPTSADNITTSAASAPSVTSSPDKTTSTPTAAMDKGTTASSEATQSIEATSTMATTSTPTTMTTSSSSTSTVPSRTLSTTSSSSTSTVPSRTLSTTSSSSTATTSGTSAMSTVTRTIAPAATAAGEVAWFNRPRWTETTVMPLPMADDGLPGWTSRRLKQLWPSFGTAYRRLRGGQVQLAQPASKPKQ